MIPVAEAISMLGHLETSMGVPTFAFFANWKGEYAVDADEEASRILSNLIVERVRQSQVDEVAILLGARGGDPCFADSVLRTIWHLGIRAHAVLTCRVDAGIANLAIGCESITLHPQAGIGALDSGLLVVPPGRVDSATLPFFPESPFAVSLDPAREQTLARLAEDRRIRQELRLQARRLIERRNEGLDEKKILGAFESSLGRGGTLDSWSLIQMGLDVRVAPGPLAEQLEELLTWCGEHLHLFGRPHKRFRVTESFVEEVEFELATSVEAAAIFTIDTAWIHELDTGSPDPDAPRLTGAWRMWDPESPEKE